MQILQISPKQYLNINLYVLLYPGIARIFYIYMFGCHLHIPKKSANVL